MGAGGAPNWPKSSADGRDESHVDLTVRLLPNCVSVLLSHRSEGKALVHLRVDRPAVGFAIGNGVLCFCGVVIVVVSQYRVFFNGVFVVFGGVLMLINDGYFGQYFAI